MDVTKWTWIGMYAALAVVLVLLSTHSCQLPRIEDPVQYFHLK